MLLEARETPHAEAAQQWSESARDTLWPHPLCIATTEGQEAHSESCWAVSLCLSVL